MRLNLSKEAKKLSMTRSFPVSRRFPPQIACQGDLPCEAFAETGLFGIAR